MKQQGNYWLKLSEQILFRLTVYNPPLLAAQHNFVPSIKWTLLVISGPEPNRVPICWCWIQIGNIIKPKLFSSVNSYPRCKHLAEDLFFHNVFAQHVQMECKMFKAENRLLILRINHVSSSICFQGRGPSSCFVQSLRWQIHHPMVLELRPRKLTTPPLTLCNCKLLFTYIIPLLSTSFFLSQTRYSFPQSFFDKECADSNLVVPTADTTL